MSRSKLPLKAMAYSGPGSPSRSAGTAICDDAIRYGTIAELLAVLGDDKKMMLYRNLYEMQLARAINRHQATKSNFVAITYHDLG